MAVLNRILYVEDEPDIQEVAKLALEAVGRFTVLICSSGRDALDKVGGFAPDVILLDVMMPEMDGPATLKAFQASPDAADIPVIFMTAKVQPQEIGDYLAMGAIGVVPKPFDPMTLSDQIREIWQKHHDK